MSPGSALRAIAWCWSCRREAQAPDCGRSRSRARVAGAPDGVRRRFPSAGTNSTALIRFTGSADGKRLKVIPVSRSRRSPVLKRRLNSPEMHEPATRSRCRLGAADCDRAEHATRRRRKRGRVAGDHALPQPARRGSETSADRGNEMRRSSGRPLECKNPANAGFLPVRPRPSALGPAVRATSCPAPSSARPACRA